MTQDDNIIEASTVNEAVNTRPYKKKGMILDDDDLTLLTSAIENRMSYLYKFCLGVKKPKGFSSRAKAQRQFQDRTLKEADIWRSLFYILKDFQEQKRKRDDFGKIEV